MAWLVGLSRFWGGWVVGVLALGVLAVIGLDADRFLLFHSLAELFSIVIGFVIFTIAWNARQWLRGNNYMLLLGFGYGLVAILDLFHTMAYPGMGVFPGRGVGFPTQLWVAARLLEVLTLLVSVLLIGGSRSPWPWIGAQAALFFLLSGLIALGWFPSCYEAGEGLTPFKIGAEYLIMAMIVLSMALLARRSAGLDRKVYGWLMISMAVTVLSELMFTLYAVPTALPNMLGHLLKIVSFLFIYRALVETGLRRPFDLLFRELKASEEELRRRGEDLETLVDQRTAGMIDAVRDLEAEVRQRLEVEASLRASEERHRLRADQLRRLAAELTQAEQRERRRLAQVLHDHLQQLLVGARLHAGLARRRGAGDIASLDQLDDLLAQSIQATRSLSVELSPPVLNAGGLRAALEWLAGRMRETHALSVEVSHDGAPEPSDSDVRTMLFHAVRELLLNVVKHAGVDAARVSIAAAPVGDATGLCVTVADDGAGFDPAAVRESFGHLSLRERMQSLGGDIRIESEPGRGTAVSLLLPAEYLLFDPEKC